MTWRQMNLLAPATCPGGMLCHSPDRCTLTDCAMLRELDRCQSNNDGDCDDPQCPQKRDGEPAKSGRSCPLYNWNRDDV